MVLAGVETAGVKAASMTAKTPSPEVQVYWKHRHDYEWRLLGCDGSVIAKGRAPSYREAKEAGEKINK